MKEETSNTEQSILKAAEKEFLKKGFSGSKTTEIAKEAGVTHAMLHYYFRTKENLFNKVFEEKAKQLADTFLSRVDESLLFLEKIKCCKANRQPTSFFCFCRRHGKVTSYLSGCCQCIKPYL